MTTKTVRINGIAIECDEKVAELVNGLWKEKYLAEMRHDEAMREMETKVAKANAQSNYNLSLYMAERNRNIEIIKEKQEYRKVFVDNEEGEGKTYIVKASSDLDALQIAFALDGGFAGGCENDEAATALLELSKTHAEIR